MKIRTILESLSRLDSWLIVQFYSTCRDLQTLNMGSKPLLRTLGKPNMSQSSKVFFSAYLQTHVKNRLHELFPVDIVELVVPEGQTVYGQHFGLDQSHQN